MTPTDFKGDAPDVQLIWCELLKLKKGQHIVLDRTRLFKSDRERLINICDLFISIMAVSDKKGYYLNMAETVFFYE